ncbi:site-2 protease family protein [Candidatus Woesearchaeota archaeon]|nr:site-2 protease family protein [Candidatus Woesearchaeota archaeon]
MFETIFSFVLKYKWVFLFYLVLIIFLIIKRKSLEIQGKIIVLYRTHFGLKWIERVSSRFREWIVLIGYIGVGAAYVGLIVISYVLIRNLYDLLFVSSTVSGVSLVLPGVSVPGLGALPFWHWLVSIFIIALVHEFAHGIVARAHNLPVKSTGLVFLGPIIGAFVEPDEKKMVKERDIKQYSVLAAGPFFNILLAIVALLLLTSVFSPVQQVMEQPIGFTFDAYYNETYPIAQAGVLPGTIITGINNVNVNEFQQFSEELACIKPNEKINLTTTNGSYSMILMASPDNPKKGFLGIVQIHNEFRVKEAYTSRLGKVAYVVVDWISTLLRWLFLLSLGIGLFNLLPLPIVDGGRMMQVSLWKIKGKEKGNKWYGKISLFFLLLLILNLVYPFVGKLFGV